jgi:phosphoenolpyruvate-protein phosphotransferase
MTMQTVHGIPASPGLAVGPAYTYLPAQIIVERHSIDDPKQEWKRLAAALDSAADDTQALKAKTERELGGDEAAIFEAQAMFLRDPSLLKAARSAIDGELSNAEWAWHHAIEGYAKQLDALEDEYLRERAADVRDVGRRVLRRLLGKEEAKLGDLQEPSVIIARDLSPSDTARLDSSLVLAFCTVEGGPTSHAAILARALGLPAVVGAGDALLTIEPLETLLVDGHEGTVIRGADPKTRQQFEARAARASAQRQSERSAAQAPARTADGDRVEVVANVGSVEDTLAALKNGAEGIGLLRTEFLYLNRDTPPNEDEQVESLRAIFEPMGDRPIVVRTLDVGGDKPLGYIDAPPEGNPFLGWRAIRMSLDRPEMFNLQLRALLRAGAHHDLRIMFPMIATLDEFRRARKMVEEAGRQLMDAAIEHHASPQVGIMVEIPAVAVTAELFAAEVDFFSIGTNDLTQYTFAAERGNARVAHLNDAAHPAVLRQIASVIRAAHAAGIWVGLCGELAGDEQIIPILLGLGLDEFSMSGPFIPGAKAVLHSWTLASAQALAERALEVGSASEVRQLVAGEAPS